MYVDNNLVLSGSLSGSTWTGQTVTGASTSVLSTNTVDLGVARDIGEGNNLFLRTQVTVAQVGATSVEIQCIAADDAALTTNVTVIGSSGAIPTASYIVGARFATGINPRIKSLGQRYIGARYVIVGTSSAGAFITDIGDEIQDGQKYHASGFAVL